MGARGWILLVTALVAMGLALFALDFPRPMSDEMAPGIRKGDLLLACRVCGRPRRGDVILFSPPEGTSAPLELRRVVAVPGDRVEIRHGRVLVDGKPLPESDGGTLTLAGIDPVSPEPRRFAVATETSGAHRYRVIRDLGVTTHGDRAPETLGDAYFVLADRRTLARDSRDYGPVPRGSVRSIVLRVLSAGDHDDRRRTRLP